MVDQSKKQLNTSFYEDKYVTSYHSLSNGRSLLIDWRTYKLENSVKNTTLYPQVQLKYM